MYTIIDELQSVFTNMYHLTTPDLTYKKISLTKPCFPPTVFPGNHSGKHGI